jgi:hypothetical protein
MKANIHSLIFFAILWHSIALSGAINDLGMGAYPLSMGEAFTAIPGEINGIYYNPASLGFLKGFQAGDSFVLLYPGLENDHIYYNTLNAALYEDHIGGFGLAWTALVSDLYQENTFYLSYGSFPFSVGPGKLSLGITPKLFSRSFGHNDYTQADSFFKQFGYDIRGFTFDAGFQYMLPSKITVGLSAANLVSSGLELSDNASPAGPVFRAGASWHISDPLTIKSKWLSSLIIASDIVYSQDIFQSLTGCDIEVYKVADITLGFDIGNNDYRRFTAGAGYQLKIDKVCLRINYGFILGLNEVSAGTYGNHLISLKLEM